jgi:hypothetical protein
VTAREHRTRRDPRRQLGLVASEVAIDLGEPRLIALQVVLGLADLLIEPHQLALAPTARLVGELDRLLGPRDLRADGVKAPCTPLKVSDAL